MASAVISPFVAGQEFNQKLIVFGLVSGIVFLIAAMVLDHKGDNNE